MSSPAPRQATWDDLLDVGEGYVGEIVGGELRVHARPGAPHVETTSDLGALRSFPFRFGRGGPVCEALSGRRALSRSSSLR